MQDQLDCILKQINNERINIRNAKAQKLINKLICKIITNPQKYRRKIIKCFENYTNHICLWKSNGLLTTNTFKLYDIRSSLVDVLRAEIESQHFNSILHEVLQFSRVRVLVIETISNRIRNIQIEISW